MFRAVFFFGCCVVFLFLFSLARPYGISRRGGGGGGGDCSRQRAVCMPPEWDVFFRGVILAML